MSRSHSSQRENPRSLEIVSQLPITYVVNATSVVDGSFSSTGRVVSIEAGKVQQPSSVAKAEMLIRAFLDNEEHDEKDGYIVAQKHSSESL